MNAREIQPVPGLWTSARILLAEDNPVNSQIATALLESLGCVVTCAENGRQAVDHALTKNFDLVLMDCQMPEMDGFEAARYIRDAERARGVSHPVPIVALTANTEADDRTASLAAGMNDHLSKPVRKDRLREMLNAHLGAPKVLEAPAAAALAPPLTSAAADLPSFDPSVLQALPMVADGSEPEFAQHVIALFADSTRALLQTLDDAALSRDGKAFQRAVHTLKSSGASVGAAALSCAAREMETLLRAGQPAAPEWPAELRQLFAGFEAAVDAWNPVTVKEPA